MTDRGTEQPEGKGGAKGAPVDGDGFYQEPTPDEGWVVAPREGVDTETAARHFRRDVYRHGGPLPVVVPIKDPRWPALRFFVDAGRAYHALRPEDAPEGAGK